MFDRALKLITLLAYVACLQINISSHFLRKTGKLDGKQRYPSSEKGKLIKTN